MAAHMPRHASNPPLALSYFRSHYLEKVMWGERSPLEGTHVRRVRASLPCPNAPPGSRPPAAERARPNGRLRTDWPTEIETNYSGFYAEQSDRLRSIDYSMRHTAHYTALGIALQGGRPACPSFPAPAHVASRPTPSERGYAPMPGPAPLPAHLAQESPLVGADAAELVALVLAMVPERDAALKHKRALALAAARDARAQQRHASEQQAEEVARLEREAGREQWRAERRERLREVRWAY